jgi:type VI protein secretion system component VasK
MRYLCYLLTQDRRPYCPLNGMIQMVPISWAENQRDLAKLCPAPAKDLQEVLESVQMQCPTLLLVTELEQLSGFSDFLERCGKTDSRFVNSRAGSRFPAGAAVDDEHAGWAVERSLHWFRGWVYAILAGDLDNNAGNRRLFRLLCGLSDYRQRLQYLLRHCFEFRKEVSQAVRLSGCYFAATGEGSSRQGFVQGVLLKVLSEQNEVAWSPRRLQRDQRARTWAMILFGVAILLIIGDLTLVGLIVRQNASSLGF